MSYIKRDLENIILDLNEQYPAILITGPRQVGKTTMLQNLMEGTDRTYVTLDDLNARALAKSDPAMFFQLYKPPILIDEVQYAPELFSQIKLLIDRSHKAGDFWLTGSQIFKMMEGVQESLAGRVAVLTLSPLSQNEIYHGTPNIPFSLDFEVLQKKQKDIKSVTALEMFSRIHTGSMPAIASGKYKDSNIFYMSYMSTYIERDIKEISGRIDSLNFLKFITSAAARCGQIVNYASIAQDADINQLAAKRWLQILETLGIVFFVHPYSNNTLKRTIKAPKLYFYDSGLVAYLTKWTSAETLESGAMSGALLENYVISEIFKSYHNDAKEPFIYYYRDRDMKEIDIIIEVNGNLHPIEIKKTATPSFQLINVFKLIDKTEKRGNGAILCMAEELSAFNADNYIVPIALI